MRSASTSQPLEARAQPGRGGAGRDEQRAQRRPLGVPGAGGALVLLLHRGEQRRDQPGRLAGAGARRDRGDRVALVRHRGRAAGRGLAHLADLGLREQHDVAGRLRDRARRRCPSAAASAAIRLRSVCHGSTGSSSPSSAAKRASTLGPEAVERAGRAAELRGGPERAPSARAGGVEPAPSSPRPSARTWSARPAGAACGPIDRRRAVLAREPRGRVRGGAEVLAQRPRARRGRRASPPCRGCPGSWRRGATSRRRPARAAPATSGTTGLPLSAARSPELARVELAPRAIALRELGQPARPRQRRLGVEHRPQPRRVGDRLRDAARAPARRQTSSSSSPT